MEAIYYIYILFDWLGVPRYVGKGRGKRWEQHERQTDPSNWLKNEFIERTWIMIGEIPKIKVQEGMTESGAFFLEKSLIKAIGRIDLNTGSLTNMSDGGEGLDSETAKKHWRRYIDSLTNEEKSIRALPGLLAIANMTDEQRKRRNQKQSIALRQAWADKTPEERRAIGLKVAEKMGVQHYKEMSHKGNLAIGHDRHVEIGRSSASKLTKEQRTAAALKRWSNMTEQQRREFSLKGLKASARRSDEERQVAGAKTSIGLKKYHDNLSKEEASARGRKIWESQSPERRSEHNRKVANSKKPWSWITDGNETKTILKGEVLPEGWRIGRANSRSTGHWITDGENNRKITDLDDVPVGWARGRTIKWL